MALGALAILVALRLAAHPSGFPEERVSFFFKIGLAGVGAGLLIIIVGWKFAKRIDPSYDPNDPAEPRMKF